MSKVIMDGCDLHQRTMVLRFCAGTAQPEGRTFENATCELRKLPGVGLMTAMTL